MKLTSVLSAFCIISFLTSYDLQAENKVTVNIRIAAPSSEPYVYLDKQSKPKGFLIDFFSLIEKQTGISASITVMPWVRGMHEVKFGQFDALIPTLFTQEREKFLVYPDESLIDFQMVLLKRSEDKFTVNNIDDVGVEKIIAKKRAMSLGKHFDDAERTGKISVKEVRDHEHAIQMLVHSRVDLVACFESVSYYALDKLKLRDKVEVLALSNNSFPAYLAFSKPYANEHDVNDIIQKINQVKATPDYQALVDKYLQ